MILKEQIIVTDRIVDDNDVLHHDVVEMLLRRVTDAIKGSVALRERRVRKGVYEYSIELDVRDNNDPWGELE